MHDLEEQGYLEKIEDYTHNVSTCYRCHNDVEPLISAQWFVKMEPLAKEAIRVVEDGETKFVPERFDQDLSTTGWRTSTTGASPVSSGGAIRFPRGSARTAARYTVSREDPTECCHCGSKHIVREEDVLDTWFSSALWPFETLGWPDKTEDLDYFYPTDVLVTGYDIIFFWVARMIFSGCEQMEEAAVPHGAHPRSGAGRQGPEDEQVSGQRHRPSGDGKAVRRRRPAHEHGYRQQPRKRYALLCGAVRGHAELCQ